MGVEGDSVDDGGDEAGVGEDGSPLTERQVGSDGDRCSFFSFGDDLEEEFGAAWVDLDVAQFVDLSRYRHRPTYADPVTMPRVWRREPETLAAAVISMGTWVRESAY